jgi:hypothetical protein
MSTEKINYDRFARKKQELLTRLSYRNPQVLAKNTSTQFTSDNSGGGEFKFLLWGTEIYLTFPEFKAFEKTTRKLLSELDLVMLLYYFDHANMTHLSDKWISFAELPDGQFYNQAFQGYTGNLLARTFSDNQDAFNKAASEIGGKRFELGDSGFIFDVLPKVPILAVYWLGDEDFPSSSQILFDSSAGHFLPTDAYAILGSTLTRKLIKSR